MAVLLARACYARLVFKYPLFFVYLSFVLLTSSCLFLVYLTRRDRYGPFYWYVEFPTAALGCAVVWEIYRGALGHFPGAARMARNMLILALVIVLSKTIADAWLGSGWWPDRTMIELERDLRGVQAGVLIGLLAVIAVYRIPMGANLWGMMLGYGLLISSNVITLTLRGLLGHNFQTAWNYLQPLSYVAVLCIWCVGLWSYKPVALPENDPKIERDYQLLVGATSRALLQARTYLRRTLRP